MRVQITIEQFQLNEILKIIQRTINWKIRVGYYKGSLTPLLVAVYAGGYIVRNINLNSMSADIQELSTLLKGEHDKFTPATVEEVMLLDDILKNENDFIDVRAALFNSPATSIEIKIISTELEKENNNGKH